MTKKQAIMVILSDKAKYTTTLNYTVDYCRAALTMDEDSEAFRVQVLYILANLSHWRHPDAKAVRETLRRK
jgi:hypothetical protein